MVHIVLQTLKFLLLGDQLPLGLLQAILQLDWIELLSISNSAIIGPLRLQLFHWILDTVRDVLHQ